LPRKIEETNKTIEASKSSISANMMSRIGTIPKNGVINPSNTAQTVYANSFLFIGFTMILPNGRTLCAAFF
jgi:hypothetical protein